MNRVYIQQSIMCINKAYVCIYTQGAVNFTENGARYIKDVALLQYRRSGITLYTRIIMLVNGLCLKCRFGQTMPELNYKCTLVDCILYTSFIKHALFALCIYTHLCIRVIFLCWV